jgi:hypothetical protein
MNQLISIEVDCYSGYKADEYPVRFRLDGMTFVISEITDRWYQGENSPDFPVANYYKVRTNDGKSFILKHLPNTNNWHLLTHGESLHL